MAGHLLERPQKIIDPNESTSHPEARRTSLPNAPSATSTKDSRNDSTSHPEARRTSLPSAPSATTTDDPSDDSSSHPEATPSPSGCSGCAKNSIQLSIVYDTEGPLFDPAADRKPTVMLARAIAGGCRT